MQTKRWKNQYIELSRSKPDYLISASGRALEEEQCQQIRQRLRGASQVIFDLGSGSGGFTIGLAQSMPQTLVVGVEIRFKRAVRAAQKTELAGLSNLFFVRTDISDFLKCIDGKSIAGCYVNFPDPWSKARWKKHRLLNQDFFSKISQLLKPNAFFIYRTDHSEYFNQTVNLVEGLSDFRIEEAGIEQDIEQNYQTESEFGLLFKSKNQVVNKLIVKRI